MKNLRYIILVVVIILTIVGFLFFPSLIPRNNLQLTRYIYKGMVEGKPEIVPLVAWERFNAFGADVGAEFSRQPDEQSRLSYAQALVYSFANTVARSGGRFEDLTHWRYDTSGGGAVIAADFPRQDQIVLFEIARVGGKRKLVSMSWGKEPRVPPGTEE